MAVSLVYVNAGDRAEAERIGRAAVESRLAAAANVVPGLRSIHRWQGELRERDEALLVLKTQPAMVERLVAEIRARHGYECPSILTVAAESGDPAYEAWVVAETGGAA